MPKKLKILMFNRWVGYNEGGNETHIKELALFLSRQGHKVDILTTGNSALQGIRKDIRKIIEVDSPKEYFSYSSLKIIYSLKYLIDSFKIFHRLLRVENRKYDVITVHFSIEAFLMRFVRLIYGIPYVLILVGDTELELIEGKRANNTSQLTHYMARECLHYGYYPEVLTKGVDKDRFNRHISGRTVRAKYIKNKNQFLVLAVARLDPRKNFEVLIKSAEILEKKYRNKFKFVIVGGGVEENKLKRMVAKKKLEKIVHFTGSIPSTSTLLPQHYAAADLFALPTLYEGFGYVFSEAMSFGLPVLSTYTSAVPEVVEGVGLLVPIKSPKKFAEAIHKVYSNKILQKELKRKSIFTVEQWYWDVLIGKYETFIRNGIVNYNSRSSTAHRVIDFTYQLILDLPRSFLSFLRNLRKAKDQWGPKHSTVYNK